MNQALQGTRVLVTRPLEKAKNLAQAIQARGGRAWVLPMLEIVPKSESQSMRNTLLALDQFQKVIVISQHAARIGLEWVENYWPQMPTGLDWFAIGASTASTLAGYNVQAQYPHPGITCHGVTCHGVNSPGIDSEALLAMNSFANVQGENILIFKGEGGRDFLEQTLVDRGAKVQPLALYKRQQPNIALGQAVNLIRQHDINIILAASGETVNNLGTVLNRDLESAVAQQTIPTLLKNCLLVVPSDRVARQSRAIGFNRVYPAKGASNRAMLAALDSINSEEPS